MERHNQDRNIEVRANSVEDAGGGHTDASEDGVFGRIALHGYGRGLF